MNTKWTAKWIWCAQNGIYDYNQTVIFQKSFCLLKTEPATLRITADSFYRISINGKWIHDGPARAYPDRMIFDTFEVGGLLKKGRNQIEVIVRYYGIGTLHRLPQQAGLLAQLDTNEVSIGTDMSWQAAPSRAWKQWTPKINISMEPVEAYDARLGNEFDWQPAVETTRAVKISKRQVGLLTKKPRRFKQLHSATLVKRLNPIFCVPVTQVAHPGLIEANGRTSHPVILASVLTVRKKQQFDFSPWRKKDDLLNPTSKNWIVSVNGRILKTGKITLPPGRYLVLFTCATLFGHEKDFWFPYLHPNGGHWGKWTVAVLAEFLYHDTDLRWISFGHEEAERLETNYKKKTGQLATACKTEQKFTELLDGQIRTLPEEKIFMEDPQADFFVREPIGTADGLFDGVTVKPSRTGDMELCFDLGEQTCGYFDFSIIAEEGVCIDLNAVEYITPDGTIQHTLPYNRNGMRYITKQGINRYTSLKRRGGRYLFLTLRNQKSPVKIESLRIIESTAPVKAKGSFSCSDPMLNRLWKMSERTLQLCMEDTFTDCPLYEQTLWIGDARNEALYAFTAYANVDVSERGLELGAESLARFPIVGCEVPSAWSCLLPAWSFLWGIHVWEHYFYSGDQRFLKKIWLAVQRNIEGALGMLDQNGLFSGPFWNLIEWAPIDQDHHTVLHNNLLLIGTLRSAEKCAGVLHDETAQSRLIKHRKKLTLAVNRHWNSQKGAYPDSIHENGAPSPKTCQHTLMLAVIFDVLPKGAKNSGCRNLLNPPEDMTPVCSPFASQFLYEALEKINEPDAVLHSIRSRFGPMVEAGASTVWETFPGSSLQTYGFPTRSHCHAWSSSPVYFLNRIVLGIRQTKPGGKAFEISPWINGLNWARGATATPYGPVYVEWKKIKGNVLKVIIKSPAGIKAEFKTNSSHKGLKLEIETRGVF